MSSDSYVSPLGLDVLTLESSFNLLAPRGEELVCRFYEELFKRAPAVIPMFDNTTPEEQQEKLLDAIKLVIENVRMPEVLAPALSAMGERHQGYGVLPDHYPVVASTLIGVMKDMAGDAWTDSIESAWTHALNIIAKVMIDAYIPETGTHASQPEQAANMSTTTEYSGDSQMNKLALNDVDVAELSRLRSAVGGAMQAMMMIDRDFNITYANKATMDLLKKHETTLQGAYPGFKADKVLGVCIDTFHKNPAHQRKLLDDPNNLPYTTTIQIADLSFKLNVTAMFSGSGEYTGNTLEWADVSNELAQADQATRLLGAVSGSGTAMIMVDRDFIVTYANKSTTDLLGKHKVELGKAFPGFDPDKLMGACIDIFHKNPAHQRKLLDDVNNLPYTTDIAIGDLTFSLNVTAIIDSAGEYVGNTLEWSDVTELRARENHVARLQGSVDASMQAMIMIDRDFNITYANQATKDLLTKYQSQLTQAFPGFNPQKLMGSCIDMFHKDPSHQRKLLADPNNCPYQTDIKIGDLQFSLNVTAITDAQGSHVGNTLEWNDVTETRQKELEVARLQSAVDGAQANLMICDKDLVITYANPSVVDMMAKRAEALRKIFPGFDAYNLVGQCIDQFHKNPPHQRQLLGNAANLPAKAEVSVAGLEFTVNATAIVDHQGNMMGNMVEWGDVTEQRYTH